MVAGRERLFPRKSDLNSDVAISFLQIDRFLKGKVEAVLHWGKKITFCFRQYLPPDKAELNPLHEYGQIIAIDNP